MKYLFIYFFAVYPFCFNKTTKLVFLFDQKGGGRPLANTINVFWQDQTDFDSVLIHSKKLLNKIDEKLNNLKIAEGKFSIHAAVIRYTNNVPKDTLYTDRFLQFWSINGKTYEDTTEYFEKAFVNFFDDH